MFNQNPRKKRNQLITVKFNGTLGNNLWQYSVARLFAEETGQLLATPKIRGFSSCNSLIPGKVNVGKKEIYTGHHLPEFMPNRRSLFNGSFERYENIAGNLDRIKTWVRSDEAPDFLSDSNDLVLSIRRGFNGWPVSLCPSVDDYEELVKKFEFKTLWICTDSPYDSFIQNLMSRLGKSKLVNMNRNKQFSFIATAERVIMAPSTFTFWATITGRASKVYWPRIPALDFSQTAYDWFPYDDPRVEWIDP